MVSAVFQQNAKIFFIESHRSEAYVGDSTSIDNIMERRILDRLSKSSAVTQLFD